MSASTPGTSTHTSHHDRPDAALRIPAMVERVAGTTEPIDALLATEDVYRLPLARIAELRVTHLRRAITHHRDNNPAFDRYCDRVRFDVATLKDESDLARIPLLPTGIFKRPKGLVASQGTVGPVVATTSSGTLGTVSVIPRDDVTLMRFFSSVAVGKREVCGVETFDRHIFNIGPATREAPNLWIAYVMAGVAVIYTTRCYVQNDVFDIEQLVADMTAVPHSEGISVVGPPPLLLDLAKFLEARGGVALGDRALVLATGGWKRRQGEAVARGEFDRRVTAALGLAAIEQVRDTYNMVELNTVMFECAHKAKHCAPWVYASARDPRTLAELPSGQAGLLAFADPTPTSYPGFVLSDDFGTVQRRVQCACGIAGDTLTIERRVNKVETRGCALKLETVGSPT